MAVTSGGVVTAPTGIGESTAVQRLWFFFPDHAFGRMLGLAEVGSQARVRLRATSVGNRDRHRVVGKGLSWSNNHG